MTAVVSLYRFCALRDIDERRQAIEAACLRLSLKGTVLLAPEGFNVALAGRREALHRLIADHFPNVDAKWSFASSDAAVFGRLKVRAKKEIVTFGSSLDAGARVGEHVDAAVWNRLLADPQVLVLDTRNAYESALGRFRGARCTNTASFREFPDFVAQELDPQRHRRVAMYCTGGIRCEKASAHLLEQGFERVHQLDGGVLRYLAETDATENEFDGECFVFDDRGSITSQDVDATPANVGRKPAR